MTKTIAWAAALMMTTGFSALAQTPAPSTPAASGSMAPMAPMAATGTAKVSKADMKFVDTAASGGMAEVQAAQLAQQKSQDAKVKEFAGQMITDHTANNQQLTTLAQQKGLTVPAALDEKDQKQIDKLTKLDGAKFDKVYWKGQVRDHKAMLKLMEKEASSGKDADLKSFASSTAPVVQKHLDMLKADGAM
jgi:putative membrane protein